MMTEIRSIHPETTLQRSKGIKNIQFERKVSHQTLCERVQRSESCMICIIDVYVKWI